MKKRILVFLIIVLVCIAIAVQVLLAMQKKKEDNNILYIIAYSEPVTGSTPNYHIKIDENYNVIVEEVRSSSVLNTKPEEKIEQIGISDEIKSELKAFFNQLENKEEKKNANPVGNFVVTDKKQNKQYEFKKNTEEYEMLKSVIKKIDNKIFIF